MERLELLGDSVLKYAVSCNLFLRYPQKHEGQLSAYRSRAVSNATLHKLGISRNLQVRGTELIQFLAEENIKLNVEISTSFNS